MIGVIKIKRFLCIVAVLLIISSLFVPCLADYYSDGTSAYKIDNYELEGTSASYAGSPIATAIGVGLLASGFAGITVGQVVGPELADAVFNKMDSTSKTTLADKIRNGTIRFKNGAMELTGSAWNWLLQQIAAIMGTASGSIIVGDGTIPVSTSTQSTAFMGNSVDMINWYSNLPIDTNVTFTAELPQVSDNAYYSINYTYTDGRKLLFTFTQDGQNFLTCETTISCSWSGVKPEDTFNIKELTLWSNHFIWGATSWIPRKNTLYNSWSDSWKYNAHDVIYNTDLKRLYYLVGPEPVYLSGVGELYANSKSAAIYEKWFSNLVPHEVPYEYSQAQKNEWSESTGSVPNNDKTTITVPIPPLVVTPAPDLITIPSNVPIDPLNPYGLPEGDTPEQIDDINNSDPYELPNKITKEITEEVTIPEDEPLPTLPSNPTPPEGDTGDINKFKLPLNVLKTKFPFCIPFDIIRLFAPLVATAKVPDWHFSIPFHGNYYDLDIGFDGKLDDIIAIFRYFTLTSFILGLAIATKKLIWG